jgi:hypothetical protein
MSSSSPPVVTGRNIRPKARDTTLEFWWGYPDSDGGAVISSYTLSCADPSVSQSVGPSSFYTKIDSLTNGTEYTFQIVADDDTNASTDPAVYRTIAPGFKPSLALSTTATAVGSGQVMVTWDPPANDGTAPIGWYVVRSVSSSPSDPIIKVSAYATDSTTTISGLNTGSMYSFNVYAVNGPGYSLPASTLSISPTLGVGDTFTYIELYEPDGGSNYTYRIYNSETDAWNVVQSPYSVSDYDGDYTSSNFYNDYSYNGTSNAFCTTYRSRYNNPSTSYGEYKFEFRNNNGTHLRTISTIANNDNWYLPRAYGNSNTGFFYNSNDATSNYDIQMYRPYTNTYQTSSITNTDSSMDSVQLLNNGVYFVTSNVDHYEHYIWNINSNSPTFVLSSFNYSYEYLYNPSTAILLVSETLDSNYYDTVTYIDDSGFTSSYSLASTTYTNVNTNRYGVDGGRFYFRAYNSNTSNYNLFAFNQLPNMTPILLSNLQSNRYVLDTFYDTVYNHENYDQTYTNDSLMVVNLQGTSYEINSGSNLNYDSVSMFNDGNYIDMKITLEDSSIPVDQSYMYYGTSYQRSNFGYLVGSVNAYPHTSLTYTTAGSNDIYVHGTYQVLNGNNGLFSTFSGSYTCANGNYGTYWVRQTGTSAPSTDLAPFGVDLWYSVENSNWGSARSSDATAYQNDPYNQYQYRTVVYGSNLIFCKSLLGSISSISGQWEGTFLDETPIVNFLQSYVNDAPFCDDPNNFSTINVRAFDEWNLSTGHVYYSSLTTRFPYIYDGSVQDPTHGKGTAYLITGSSTSVVSTVFTSSNLLLYSWTNLNSNGAGFLEQEQNVVKAHVLTVSGETSTIISTAAAFAPNYATNTNTDPFSDLFYYNIRSAISSNISSFLYILSNDGTLLTASEYSPNTNTRFSGRNGLLYQYNASNLNIIQNGVLTSTINMPYGEDNMEEPYPDFANGELAVTSYDNDSNTIIITVTNDAISTFSTNFFTDNTNSFLTQSFLMMWHDYPFTLLARDVNAGIDYEFSTIGDLYESSYYNQADSIGFEVIDDNNGATNYVVFNFSTTTFSMISTSSAENEEYTFTTSPYYYD